MAPIEDSQTGSDTQLRATLPWTPGRSAPRHRTRWGVAGGLAVAALAVGIFAIARPDQHPVVSAATATSTTSPGSGAACPGGVPAAKVTSTAEPAGRLVPFAPRSVTVCAYPPPRDAHVTGKAAAPIRTVLSAGSATELVRSLDALPPARRGFRSCPLDDGSAYLVVVQGSAQHRLELTVRRTGCRTVSDATHLRQADDALLRQLSSGTSAR